MLHDKQLLVTGSEGQIGRALIGHLLRSRIKIHGLDIKSQYANNYSFLNGNLVDKSSLEKHRTVLENIDSLIHLATNIDTSKDIIQSSEESIELNIKGLMNLLEFLPNLKQICFASSYMVYGKPIVNPVNENHSTDPINIYGVSKLIAEKFLQVYALKQNVQLVVLRFMGIYGPGTPDNGRSIPTFINMIRANQNPTVFGRGKSRRNHIYVDDAIRAIIAALQSYKSGIFNVGGNEAPSNLEIIEVINEILGTNVKPIFKETKDEEYDFISDTSYAQRELNFHPNTDLRKGLELHIEYIKNQSK